MHNDGNLNISTFESQSTSFSYESMGTRWQVAIWDEVGPERLNEIREAVIAQSQEFDQTYSRFIKTSFVNSLAERKGVVEAPTDFMAMLRWYQKLYLPSGKKLNPLIGFSISDLGYDAEYSLVTKENVRPTPDLEQAVAIQDDRHIRLAEPALFDFGALGKGYFVDQIVIFLRKQGLMSFLVDGSGDIFYSGGREPIKVGLEHPGDPTKVIGMIEMDRGAMCSSAGNRRKWGDYHHVIDPHSLTSPRHVLATWVIADSAALADGLASCLFFVPPERFAAFDFEYCILNDEYKVKRSPGFRATFW